MADYGGIGMALQAFGRGLRGGDGMAVVKDYQEGLERIKRKEAVQNMLGKMGISGQEKALLDTMDPEAVQAFLANRMQQDYARRNAPGRAPTQAEIELQQIRELSKHFGGTSEAPAPSAGGYSTGEPLDQTIGPRADLSFNVQGELPTAIQATGPTTGGGLSITPTARVPEPTPDLSFGEFASVRKPTNALEAQIAETQRKYDQAFMLAEKGIPKADHFLKLYGDRLEALKAQQQPDMSEAEQEISRLQETGFSRNDAIMIKEGGWKVITDPTTKETVLFNMLTREVINPNAKQEEMPQGTEEVAPSRFGDDRFGGAEYSFGLGGAGRNLANTTADALGFGQPFPEAGAAISDFNVMREDMTSRIQEAYNGRVPAFLLKNIQDLLPTPSRPFQGAADAQNKLRAVGRSLEQELESLNRSLYRRRLSPTEKAQIERQITAVSGGLAQIDAALDGFAPDTVDQSDIDLMNELLSDG